ncbi:VPS9 domain-containing 1 [Elysia marginata]|uniref:VPS9 domain-containing 1 n=1 Tax=Elysia marginata TaxID=1093978 RepID=A0AAV4FLN4_9GAST|nr:VPS9 domain-containing 1 [Elysia marginata]
MLMKQISEALRLDNENNEKEAYKRYVGCIYFIASNLMEAIKVQGGEVVINSVITKQIKLIQQCTDRVAELIKTLSSSTSSQLHGASLRSQSPSPSATHKSVTGPGSESAVNTYFHPNSLNVSQRIECSNEGGTAVEVHEAEESECGRFGAPVPALPPENNPHVFVARKSRSLTPMELASKQNQSLMVAFKARMLRLNQSDFNAYSYSLAIQRKMMENIAIARAQEKELARKMQARNQRLELEAAKRFASPSGMSESEKEQKEIYKKILEYENEANWLKQWREKLAENPEDPVLVCRLVQEVLRCSDHPITELLKQYQFKIYQRIFPLVEKRAKKLTQIKVPLAEDMWPPYEDIKDIVGDIRTDDRIFDKSDQKVEGNVIDHKTKPSLVASPVKEDTGGDNLPTDSDDAGSSKNIDDGSKVFLETQDDVERLNPEQFSSLDKDGEADFDDSPPQKPTSHREQNISWEMKQAKLLMKQVNKRCTLQAYMNIEEDDNLDYLFDEDDEEATESMFSSMSYTRTSPELSTPAKEESKVDENQHPSRSVSHEFRSSDVSEDQDSSAMYQSLPYSSYKERVAESEEAKKIAKLSREACESHLKAICEDVHHYLDKLLVLMTVAYEPLDNPVGKDQCAVSLEEPFFKPIWKTLLLLFRVVNYHQEQVLACVMTKYRSASPGDLNVNKKLWLISEPESASSKDSDERTAKPYEKVVTELKRVGDHYTMLSKLECIVKVCRLICECVDDFYNSRQGGKKAPSIGADDLVPILCYVVIRSEMPQLASECQAMAEFIQEGYLMGEEGYCLTTLRTALNYVTSLYPGT